MDEITESELKPHPVFQSTPQHQPQHTKLSKQHGNSAPLYYLLTLFCFLTHLTYCLHLFSFFLLKKGHGIVEENSQNSHSLPYTTGPIAWARNVLLGKGVISAQEVPHPPKIVFTFYFSFAYLPLSLPGHGVYIYMA